MRTTTWIQYAATVLIAVATSGHLAAAEDRPPPDSQPPEGPREPLRRLTPEERAARLRAWRDRPGTGPTNRIEFEKLREELRGLSPEQRQARLRELRERGGLPSREEMERRREEWRNLPPAEREARLREWRDIIGERPDFRSMTPEERQARRKEIRQRFESRLNALRQKKAEGTLTPEEARRLALMEDLFKRFEQGGPLAGPRRPPADRPPARPPEPAPSDK
jgi:ribosomal protein L29